jgi:hypothetical protein
MLKNAVTVIVIKEVYVIERQHQAVSRNFGLDLK